MAEIGATHELAQPLSEEVPTFPTTFLGFLFVGLRLEVAVRTTGEFGESVSVVMILSLLAAVLLVCSL